MEKLYRKSEIAFAVVWIVIYCLLQSIANPLNDMIGIGYSASAAFCLLQAAALMVFVKRNDRMKKYGLCRPEVPAGRFLFFIPLLVLVTQNLWNGMAVNMPAVDTACYLLCMLCVGFVEEVIFRGLLFRAMAKDNIRSAVIVSSVTFGLGHLINLINGSGAGVAENLFQVTGAIAIGFLFVILFYRGGSLWPCIISHALINMTSAFANESGLPFEKRIMFHAILLMVAVAYAWMLTRTLPLRSAKG